MQLALSDPLALTLIVLGILLGVAAVVWNALRLARLRKMFNELAFAALDGRPEEARVQARNHGRTLKPLLEALGGELVAPSNRPWLGDGLAIIALHLPLVLLIAYTLSAVRTADISSRLPAASALFIGVAVLWPVSLACSVIVVSQARRNARALRATCITLIAKAVKTQVDADLADALRRGLVRDPRGE